MHIKSLEPQTNVIILEADICGGGASGRNGGFALSWWPKIETLLERVGTEEAVHLAQASEQAISEIGAFCAAEGIDAHFRQAGWLWTATSHAQLNAWKGAVKQCERLGVHPFQMLDAAEVQRRTGSSVHLGGVLESSGATVQPALLARGLRRVALQRGVNIYERTPVKQVDRDRRRVYTPHGVVQASVIVLANNAWAARIPELRRAIVPLSSDMVVTAPMPDILDNMGWTNGEAISNSRLMVHYYRTTRDGRIAFGKGGGALGLMGRFGSRFDYSEKRTEDVIRDLWKLVPQSQPVTITNAWGGAVDRSEDGLPFFGRLRGKHPIFYGVGFSGNGVAPSFLAGKILASTALERQDEWSTCGLNRGIPSRFPPEPFLSVGGILVRQAVRRKETHDDRDQRVDPLTRRLAALAPSGFFKVTPANERSEDNL
ncbi:FAD-dependent oxidoreductase [Bacillaceae bacterium]